MGRFIGAFFVAALIVATIQYKDELSDWGNQVFASLRDESVHGATARDSDASAPTVVKCTTKDGVTFYNSLPADAHCDKVETIRLKPRMNGLNGKALPLAPRFSCDGRQHCSQMRSCAEARYFLAHCPGVKMDGDHDGKPCERQCGG